MKSRENEDALVRRIVRVLARNKSRRLVLGLDDDAALWAPARGHETILTCDWFLEGSHFLREKHPADAVGWKCLARAASDIAAMGGQPRCFLISLALPAELTGTWLDQFLGGLKRAAKALRCAPAGGDTTRQREVLISITVMGEVRRGQALLRSGAKPSDLIYVSGTLGEGALGLRQLRAQRQMARANNPALQKHLYPEPRLALGQWLVERRLATAMMDLSDGLSADLGRLCASSGTGACIQLDSLPRTALVGAQQARQLALHGGDDYELLFTVNPRNERRLPGKFRNVPLTCIGRITDDKKMVLESERGIEPLASGGWDPFRSGNERSAIR